MMPPLTVSVPQQRDGEALLSSLRASGVEVLAALWWLVPGPNEWRLVIVSPEVETRGPKALLRHTHKLLQGMSGTLSFTLFDLDFRSPHSSQVLVLAACQQFLGFGPHSTFKATSYNGLMLPDAYILEFNTAAILTANAPLSQLAAE